MRIYIGNAADIEKNFDNDISCFNAKIFSEDSRAALILLKYIIKKEKLIIDFNIRYNEYKKPYIKGINYNISHSKGKIAIAIGDEEVGIDIQKKVDSISNAKKKYYHEDDYDQNLLHSWVIKESYLKFVGIGLRNDLYNIRIKKDTVEYDNYETAYYKCYDLEENYALAISMARVISVEIINI